MTKAQPSYPRKPHLTKEQKKMVAIMLEISTGPAQKASIEFNHEAVRAALRASREAHTVKV